MIAWTSCVLNVPYIVSKKNFFNRFALIFIAAFIVSPTPTHPKYFELLCCWTFTTQIKLQSFFLFHSLTEVDPKCLKKHDISYSTFLSATDGCWIKYLVHTESTAPHYGDICETTKWHLTVLSQRSSTLSCCEISSPHEGNSRQSVLELQTCKLFGTVYD